MKAFDTMNDIVAVIMGVFIIIIGFMMITYKGNRINEPDNCTFGADYYTEQYEATQIVSENLSAINKEIIDIVHFAGYLCACFGVIVICKFDPLLKVEPAKKSVPAPKPQNINENKDVSTATDSSSEEFPFQRDI